MQSWMHLPGYQWAHEKESAQITTLVGKVYAKSNGSLTAHTYLLALFSHVDALHSIVSDSWAYTERASVCSRSLSNHRRVSFHYLSLTYRRSIDVSILSVLVNPYHPFHSSRCPHPPKHNKSGSLLNAF